MPSRSVHQAAVRQAQVAKLRLDHARLQRAMALRAAGLSPEQIRAAAECTLADLAAALRTQGA